MYSNCISTCEIWQALFIPGFLHPAYVARREGNAFTGISLMWLVQSYVTCATVHQKNWLHSCLLLRTRCSHQVWSSDDPGWDCDPTGPLSKLTQREVQDTSPWGSKSNIKEWRIPLWWLVNVVSSHTVPGGVYWLPFSPPWHPYLPP